MKRPRDPYVPKIRSDDWRKQALCAEPENRYLMWFPQEPEWDGMDYRRLKTEKLRVEQVCARCPVRAECHDYAETHHVTAGYWAGKNYSVQRHGTW